MEATFSRYDPSGIKSTVALGMFCVFMLALHTIQGSPAARAMAKAAENAAREAIPIHHHHHHTTVLQQASPIFSRYPFSFGLTTVIILAFIAVSYHGYYFFAQFDSKAKLKEVEKRLLRLEEAATRAPAMAQAPIATPAAAPTAPIEVPKSVAGPSEEQNVVSFADPPAMSPAFSFADSAKPTEPTTVFSSPARQDTANPFNFGTSTPDEQSSKLSKKAKKPPKNAQLGKQKRLGKPAAAPAGAEPLMMGRFEVTAPGAVEDAEWEDE